MFTPKKQWTELSVAEKSWTDRTSRKKKAVIFVDEPPPPPPTGLLSDEGGSGGYRENMEDWKKFREVGLLDKALVEERDREARRDSIKRLEGELLSYQHNMGMLLIEKNEWTLKHEELQGSLREASEILKREKAANLIAISQAEERESNIRSALDVEKRSVAELERSLRKLHSDLEKIRTEYEAKLAEANELAAGVQEKSMEMQKRSLEADAKLSEANKKSVELGRKFQEVETRENVLKSERLSFISERDAHESTFMKHKEDMREWERKLQEREERLCRDRRDMNDRDERVTEYERKLTEKEKELEVEHNTLELEDLALKKRESEVIVNLNGLKEQQEKVDSIRISLEMKEKDLKSLAERLTAREQRLLDKHQSTLDAKEHEFEVTMEEKRRLFLEEYQMKLEVLDKKLAELDHMEIMVKKQDETVEKKLERVTGRDKDVQSKMNGLKNKEKALNLESKNLDSLRDEVASQKENVQALRDKLENIKSEVSQKKVQVTDENEKLRIAEKERNEHTQLLNEMEQELERYIHRSHLLSKESDKMKEDKKRFEEEWKALNEKRAGLTRDLQQLEEEKKMAEVLKMGVDEELNGIKISSDEHMKRELEFLRLSKESFEVSMKHEQSLLVEKALVEHELLLNEYEHCGKELEAKMQEKKEEMERSLQERGTALEKTIEMENNNTRRLKEVLQKEIDNIRCERNILKLDEQNTSVNKRRIKEQQAEMQKDVNELHDLCQKHKMQREEFIRDRQKFAYFTEALSNCRNCGMVNCTLPGLDGREVDAKLDLGVKLLEKVASYKENTGRTLTDTEPKSTGSVARISQHLQKFSQGLFNLSPNNRHQHLPSPNLEQASVSAETSVPVGSVERHFRVQEVLENTPVSHFKSRASSVKGVVEDSEAFRNGNSKEHPSTVDGKSCGSSYLGGKFGRVFKRKSKTQTSMVNDGAAEHTQGPYEAIGDSGRRRKLQKVSPSVDISGKQHYNLRHRKTKAEGSTISLENGSKVDEFGDAALTEDPGVNSAAQIGVSSSDIHPSEGLKSKHSEASTNHTNGNSDAGKLTRIPELSEEMNATSCYHDENPNGVAFDDHLENEDDEDEGNNASIPRKLWNFFTS